MFKILFKVTLDLALLHSQYLMGVLGSVCLMQLLLGLVCLALSFGVRDILQGLVWLSAFPPELYSQCLTLSLVFILSFIILFSSTSPSLLSHFLPSFKSILRFCFISFMLCAFWVILWNAVSIFLWLIYCSRCTHSLPSSPPESNWRLALSL